MERLSTIAFASLLAFTAAQAQTSDIVVFSEMGEKFTLIIDDLPVGTKTAKQMVQGGTMITNTLKNVMEMGKPSLGTRMLYVLFKVMGPLSPKICRSENWPVD